MRPVNLIPPDERRGSSRGSGGTTGIGVYVVLGVLAFAVLAAVAVVLTSNQIKDKDAELARLTQEEQELQSRSNPNTDYANFEQIAQQQFDAVYTTAKDRFNFARRLRQFTHVIPEDIVVNKLSAKLTPDDAADTGAAAAGGEAAPQGPTFTFDGCTSAGKPGVARLATRMRNLDSVTKVTIKKISVPDSDSSTSSSTTSSTTTDSTSNGTTTDSSSTTSSATSSGSGDGTGVCLGINNTFEMQVTFAGKGAAAGGQAAGAANAIEQANGAVAESEAANSAAGADQAGGSGGSTP